MAKPTINQRPLPDYHAGPTEKIIEIDNGHRGDKRKTGLISVRSTPDGGMIIDVFALDDDIQVNVTPDRHPQYIVTPTYKRSGLKTFGPFDTINEADAYLAQHHLAASHEVILKQLSE